MKRLFGFLFLIGTSASAVPVVPNFQQGIMTNRTETTSTIQSTVNSYQFRTGYELTVGGTNVAPSTGNVAPTGIVTTDSTNGTISTTWVSPDLSNKPAYNIVNPGASFTYFETLNAPGLVNHTQIITETTIESISDSTSTFSQ